MNSTDRRELYQQEFELLTAMSRRIEAADQQGEWLDALNPNRVPDAVSDRDHLAQEQTDRISTPPDRRSND